MFYIETNNNNEVVYVHSMPFDEAYGLGKTEEELQSTGFLVEDVPKVENELGFQKILKFVNDEFIIDKKPIEDFSVYDPEVGKKIQNLVVTRKEYFESMNYSLFNIEQLKSAKLDALKEQCTQAIHEGFESTTIGKSFGFNEHDQNNFTQQLLLIVAAGGNYTLPIKWKALDGSVNELTSEQFQALIGEATAHKISNQEKFWALEQQLLAATTKEEIIAIEW